MSAPALRATVHEGEVLGPESPYEELAQLLHWNMCRLEPDIEQGWDSLTEFDRNFYRFVIEGLLVDRGAIDRAYAKLSGELV